MNLSNTEADIKLSEWAEKEPINSRPAIVSLVRKINALQKFVLSVKDFQTRTDITYENLLKAIYNTDSLISFLIEENFDQVYIYLSLTINNINDIIRDEEFAIYLEREKYNQQSSETFKSKILIRIIERTEYERLITYIRGKLNILQSEIAKIQNEI
jgi:hypothetical protein